MVERVDVGMGHYEVAEVPIVLSTRGLGPCIGIVIYDKISRRGYLAHSDGLDLTAVRKVVEIATEGQGKRILRAVVSGGSKVDKIPERYSYQNGNISREDYERALEERDQGNAQLEAVRAELLESLRKREIRVRNRLATMSDRVSSLRLYTTDGRMIVEECWSCWR
ncbi:MAG TPA: hypothetical protein VJA47_04855 [archaeon]|nr:hypothetical protein [archaeon]